MDQCPELGSPISEAQAWHPARAPRPFWEVWGLLPALSRCSVGVVPHVDVFLMYLWGGSLSPGLTPLPSWRSPVLNNFQKFFSQNLIFLVKFIPTCHVIFSLLWMQEFFHFDFYLVISNIKIINFYTFIISCLLNFELAVIVFKVEPLGFSWYRFIITINNNFLFSIIVLISCTFCIS